jgi:HSP20 family molecular chaperone IbpA
MMFDQNGPFSKGPFSSNGPFSHGDPFQQNNHQFPKDYFKQIKGMMSDFQHTFDQEFWRNIQGLHSTTHKKRTQLNFIPIEVWETEEEYYILANTPGIKKEQNILLEFESNQSLTIKIKVPLFRPSYGSKKLHSEFSSTPIERKIDLPQPVSIKSYTLSCKDGICYIILKKIVEKEEVNIPFDF